MKITLPQCWATMSMDHKEIDSKLDEMLEELERTEKEWAYKKSEKERFDDLKDSTLAVIMGNSMGESEAERKRHALTTQRWQEYLIKKNKALNNYLDIEAKRSGLQMKIDVYRSKLSFEKTAIERHI